MIYNIIIAYNLLVLLLSLLFIINTITIIITIVLYIMLIMLCIMLYILFNYVQLEKKSIDILCSNHQINQTNNHAGNLMSHRCSVPCHLTDIWISSNLRKGLMIKNPGMINGIFLWNQSLVRYFHVFSTLVEFFKFFVILEKHKQPQELGPGQGEVLDTTRRWEAGETP